MQTRAVPVDLRLRHELAHAHPEIEVFEIEREMPDSLSEEGTHGLVHGVRLGMAEADDAARALVHHDGHADDSRELGKVFAVAEEGRHAAVLAGLHHGLPVPEDPACQAIGHGLEEGFVALNEARPVLGFDTVGLAGHVDGGERTVVKARGLGHGQKEILDVDLPLPEAETQILDDAKLQIIARDLAHYGFGSLSAAYAVDHVGAHLQDMVILFRKGMVPMSLVKKMYGKSVIAEEVNKLLSEKVYDYIKSNNVNMLGEPLPNEEKQQVIDFDTMEEFEFVFDIALAPEFKAEVSNTDKVDYYTIEVTDEMVENQVKAYTQRNGKYDQVSAYEDNDMLKGLIAELDENGNTKEGGIQVEGAVLMPSYMKNDEQKAIFANAKVNDVLVFNPNAAYDGHDAEIASLLKIEKEAAAEMKSNFSFQVEEITRFVPGDLNQELFDQVFGKDAVKTEEEFRAKVKEGIAAQFVADSDYKFLIDARKMLMEKVGKLEFPDALLKRIMLLNNKEKGEEFVAENYEKSVEELTWHLIKEQLVKDNEIKVEQEDVINMAKDATKAQFAQYGMMTVPEDILENYAQEMLKKKENVDGLVGRVVEAKLATALKAKVTLNNKTVSMEEFNKMFE